MKKNISVSLSIALFLAASSAYAGGSNEPYVAAPAKSESHTSSEGPQFNWYLSGAGLANFVPDQGSDTTPNIETSFDTGYGALIAVGRQINYGDLSGLRAELEAGYRHNDIDTFFVGALTISAGGDLNIYSGMANMYYDFKNSSPFTPYVGAGFGAAYATADNITVTGIPAGNDDETVFAYQGMAGVSYAICQTWDAKLEYRYFATTDIGALEYDSHDAVLGLTYKFY